MTLNVLAEMKSDRVLLMLGMVLCACGLDTRSDADDFDWLLGQWIRVGGEEGMDTFERWKKINDEHYQGVGHTEVDGDTVWWEAIDLVQEQGQWRFRVRGEEEEFATEFLMTASEASSFSVENPENEFPKRIDYRRKGDRLQARISGGEQAVDFVFEPWTSSANE